MSSRDQEPSGVLGICKPPGMTSHDMVALCRRVFCTRAVGHAGTLDPLAAGVLPVLIGAATRLAEHLASQVKEYRAEVVFGVTSDTGDLAGNLAATAEPPRAPRADDLVAAVVGLQGEIRQVPPAYSARKVGGRKLYDLARSGDITASVLAQAARPVTVYAATVLRQGPLGWGQFAAYPAATIDIQCSSGTYVRELASRLGEVLGLPACLGFLLRRQCAGLRLADCIDVESLMWPSSQPVPARFAGRWRSLAAAVPFLPAWLAGEDEAVRLANGLAVPLDRLTLARRAEAPWDAMPMKTQREELGWVAVLGSDHQLVALAQIESAHGAAGPVLRPRKVFAR